MSTYTDQLETPASPHLEIAKHAVPDKKHLPTGTRKQPVPGWAQVLILLELASLLTLLGGDFLPTHSGSATPLEAAIAVSGPFNHAPLSPVELNNLQHLSTYVSPKTLANMYLSRMTLDQKLGQLFMVQYWGYAYSSDLEKMIRDQYAGGVIMYGAQMNTFQQTKNDITHMQMKAWMPLLISTDEEGGFVQRVMNI